MGLRLLGLLIVLLLVIPSFAQDDDDVLVGEAFVNSISVDDSEGIVITIEGELADACTEVGDITQSVEDDTILVMVATSRPVDCIGAMVLTTFEDSYELDTSEIEAGEYTLDVNGITETVTIAESSDGDEGENEETVELTCPEPDDETILFDDLGMCFVYPIAFGDISGNDFVLISQPLESDAVLLIDISDADDVTLDDLQEQFEDGNIDVETVVIGGEDAIVIEFDDTREAYIIVDEQLYAFFVQPIDADVTDAEILWATVIDSIFFPEPEDE